MRRQLLILATGLLLAPMACAGGDDREASLTAPATTAVGAMAETGSPSSATTEQFLSGMFTEEVEPGVLRVLNDGFRGLTHPSDGYPWECERIIVGDNDQVWRARSCWRLYRLGHPGEWDYDREWVNLGWSRSFASLDGRLWALESGGLSPTAPYYLRMFDDGVWVPDPRLDLPSEGGQIYVEDDGTVWLLGQDAIHWAGDTVSEAEARGGSSSWTDGWVGESDRDGVFLLSVTDDGVVWLMTERAADGTVSFLRFNDETWKVVPAPDGFDGWPGGAGGAFGAGVSAGGVLWAAADSLAPHLSLARLDEDGWTTFSGTDGVRPWGGQRAWWNTTMDTLWVAPDGSAWVNASVAAIRADGSLGCDGLARFDGETWQSFLSGRCISDLGFVPDGSAWVVARDPRGYQVRTYVIIP